MSSRTRAVVSRRARERWRGFVEKLTGRLDEVLTEANMGFEGLLADLDPMTFINARTSESMEERFERFQVEWNGRLVRALAERVKELNARPVRCVRCGAVNTLTPESLKQWEQLEREYWTAYADAKARILPMSDEERRRFIDGRVELVRKSEWELMPAYREVLG